MLKRSKIQLAAFAATLVLIAVPHQPLQADDCLVMKNTTLISGEVGSWKIGGFEPGDHFAIVWGTKLGSTPVKNVQNYCANFGIAGVSTKRILGQGTADSFGTGYMDRKIPNGTSGLTVYTQAAKRDTCPDECTSNVVESTIQ